jgi:enoyl-CoA hydratase/carnithine racemase
MARDDRLARIVLNRPAKLNALDEETRVGLESACRELADDPNVSVVVLSGAGSSFSAGADLSGGSRQLRSAPSRESSWAARRHAAGAWQRTLAAIEALPQVTVAALHGHCIGGGALLAASCDIRVADATLRVRIPELAIGIPLTWAGIPRLAREIGLPLTRDLVMTGRTINGEEAHRCGYVQRLAAGGALEAAVEQLIHELMAMPAGPLAITKAMTRALGHEREMALAWADADLLHWSQREPESEDAATGYVASHIDRRST